MGILNSDDDKGMDDHGIAGRRPSATASRKNTRPGLGDVVYLTTLINVFLMGNHRKTIGKTIGKP